MTLADEDPDVAALRAFNRLYTRRLGLLNPHLDNSPFTLTEARILYELAQQHGLTAADIGRALDIDRAQLSRTLKRFADRGLVDTINPGGGRRQQLSLTPSGRDAFGALERNTRAAVGGLLDSLPQQRRKALVGAAKTFMHVFEGDTEPTLRLRDPQPGDLGLVVHRQAVLYAKEYGWNRDYEALVSRILADFAQSFDPSREAAWIAELDGRMVGSIFLVRGDEPGTGKLRLLYVEPDARGYGIGSKLVTACIQRAREVGYDRLTLWTNNVLISARHIYERAGFKLVSEEPHNSFGKDLTGQTWSLDLG